MPRRLILALTAVFALFAAPAFATDLGAMSDAEREAFREEVRAYLLDNPEVLMEAIAVLERRQAAEQVANDAALIARHGDYLFDDGYSFVGGNPDGDLTLVEFMDYRCGYCRKAFPEVEELIAVDGNIRYIIKEFPILGEESVLASRFAISTHLLFGDDAYKALHNALMEMRANSVTEDVLLAIAGDLGLDGAAILEGIADPRVDAIIGSNHALAGALDISGTPGFILGDQILRGYVPLDGMRQIVEELRVAADK